MRFLKYICLLVAIVFSLATQAQFNPTNPPEPGGYRFSAKAVPADAGTVSPAEQTVNAGAKVSVSARANSGYLFVRWENEAGEDISTSTSLSFEMPARDVEYTAVFRYAPSNPSEPSMPETKAQVTATVEPAAGGSVRGNGTFTVGSSVYIYATNNSGYQFLYWTLDDEIISESTSLKYTVREKDNNPVAHFVYSPGSPTEPSHPEIAKKSILYLQCSPKDACSFNRASGDRVDSGSSIKIVAYPRNGYRFIRWTDDSGETVALSTTFNYTATDSDVTLTAEFEYSPDSPGEPATPSPRRNIIYGARQVAMPGNGFIYDISLENVDVLTGMNIDVKFPEEIVFHPEAATISSRAGSHTLSCESLGGGSYRYRLQGTEAIAGANGAMIRIPAEIPMNAEVDATYVVALSKGVAYKADGSQDVVDATDGSVKIAALPETLPDSPDFIVRDITVAESDVKPGDTVTLAWSVENAGNIEATGGWSESIYLIDENGKRTTLGSTYYDTDRMAVGEKVSRTATLALSALPGLSGKTNVSITLVPYAVSGEIEQRQFNNTLSTKTYPLGVAKQLILELPASATEGSDAVIRGRIARSGSWANSETFTLRAIAEDSRVTFPTSVTVSKDHSAAYFQINLADNAGLDGDHEFSLEASGNDYEPAVAVMTIVDDEYPELSLDTSVDDIEEGEEFTLTVGLPVPAAADLTISLAAEDPARLFLASEIIIAKGATAGSTTVTAVENTLIEGDAVVAIRATAPHYGDGETFVNVLDNDIPRLEMELTPSEISEDAGLTAIHGVIRRMSNPDSRVTIRISDNSEGTLYYPAKEIVLAPGVKSAEFAVGVIDNNVVDGDREYEITAAVYISSCNCTSSGNRHGAVTGTVTVIDNDGPSLALTSPSSTILEGDTNGITLTVGRNTDTTSPLTITLTSDSDEYLSYSHSVTIPAGERSVGVKVTAPANDVTGDSRTIVFSAAAEGYSKGTYWVMLTDSTLPDARVGELTLSAEEGKVNTDVEVLATVSNAGVAPLPEITCVTVYLANDPVAKLYTQAPLTAGESVVLTGRFTLPETTGKFNVHAVVNEDKKVEEQIYTNNTSNRLSLTVLPPYSASVATDKATYGPGEEIIMTGRLEGDNTASAEVEIYILNSGARQTFTASTDNNGYFTLNYTPYASQCGQFSVGACYPGAAEAAASAEFDVYGMRLPDNRAITCEAVAGESKNLTISIENPTRLALSDLKAEVVNAPADTEVSLNCPASLAAGEKVQLGVDILSAGATDGSDWDGIDIRLTTLEGVSLDLHVYYYCREPKGVISTGVTNITTNLPQGKTVEYPITLTNTGAGATGRIALSLPDWIGSSTPVALPSLAPGDSTVIVLRLLTDDRMNLNMPVTGQIGINCDNGRGAVIRYNVTPVSDEKGRLTVEACDEYTYYTAESPKVEGASVIVRNPSTGAAAYTGSTDASGVCSVELAAGYYRVEVSADKHDTYSEYVFVSPGEENVFTADISYNPITINWDVKETEIEDEYRIETNVTYETNVPMPVVRMDLPKSIDGDNMAVGDATIVNLVLTNIGLIKALEVTPILPDDKTEWKFEALGYDGPFDLNPQQSRVIPIRITRIADESSEQRGMPAARSNRAGSFVNTFNNCMAHVAETYKVICGKLIKNNTAAENMGLKLCAAAATASTIYDMLSNILPASSALPGVPGGGGGNSLTGGIGTRDTSSPDSKLSFTICDPCDAEKAERLINTLIGESNPLLSKTNEALQKAIDEARKQGKRIKVVRKPLKDRLVDFVKDKIKSKLPKPAQMAWEIYEITDECKNDDGDGGPEVDLVSMPARAGKHSWMDEFNSTATSYIDYLNSLEEFHRISFGDPMWYDDPDEGKVDFLNYAVELADADEPVMPSDEEIALHKPESVAFADAKALLNYMFGIGDNIPSDADIDAQIEIFDRIQEEASEKGFNTATDMFYDAYADYVNHFEQMKSGSSVCASISLKISQTMTMTRQAFRGTLSVFNGHESKAMSDVKLNLVVRDSRGNTATSREFQINAESLTGFEGTVGLPGGWTLGSGANGEVTVLFIPTNYAAPQEEMVYSFGGTVSYLDPFTDLVVTRTLYPVELTVKPSPELDMTYFMQRNVYADNPLTPNVVEPTIPAEFALIINNKGFGDATNVRMMTEQPEIVDNEKGLLIDFVFTGSQLNGGEKALSLGGSIATDFGDIPARSTSYVQWWLESSLLGHFTVYDVTATHVTSYGNPDLSLLDNVTIHELIHGMTLTATGSTMRGFLVNDIADAEDMPDMIYFSDGSDTQSVAPAASMNIVSAGDNIYDLTVTPSAAGWTYGYVSDPTMSRRKIEKVVRLSDGAEVDVDNLWQTAVTLRDGNLPIAESMIHVAADLAAAETFRITFEERPDVELEVIAFTGIPAEDAMLHAPLQEATVFFSKAIDATTFSAADLTLKCAGEDVDLLDVAITPLGDDSYKLSFNSSTQRNGYYVLTVNTAGIVDSEGFAGRYGKSCSWLQYADGKVSYTATASPADAGTVTPRSAQVDYGSELTFTATAAEGYEFAGWLLDGSPLTSASTFTRVMTADEDLVARFIPRHYNVEILYDPAKGRVENASSGLYEYNSALHLVAVPEDGYSFARWLVGGEEAGTQPEAVFTVAGDMEITAEFSLNVPSGLGEASASSFRVYPLPLHDVMTVDGGFATITELLIIDMTGKEGGVWRDLPCGSSVEVLQLPEGFYIVRAVTDSGTFTRKVYKR